MRPRVPGGVRGVRAVRAIARGETLVRVPAAVRKIHQKEKLLNSLSLTFPFKNQAMLVNSSQVLHLHGVRTSVLLEPNVELRWRRSCDACGVMSFVMLDERRPGHVSRWQPFLRLLELDSSVTHIHPMLFSSYRLSQQTPAVRLYVTETRRRLRACYESIFNVEDSRVGSIVGSLSDPAPQFVFHLYLDAALECAAHQFGVSAQSTRMLHEDGTPIKVDDNNDDNSKYNIMARGEARLTALIPGADLFAAPPESVRPQAKLRRVPGSLSPLVDDYVIEAMEDVPVGQEITADWFPRICAEQQLCSYGYIYDSTTEACTIDQAVNL